MKNALLLSCLLLLSTPLLAEDAYWELGAGATAITLPLYPGSKQDDSFVIPFPFVHIQTEHFEVNEGVRGFFYESPDLRLNISGDLGVPVNSEDSEARSGMPDLDTVLQLGPSLEIIFAGGRRQPSELRLELPLRTAIATDFKHAQNIGWILEPRLTYETLRPRKTGFAYQVSTGLRYATDDYHAYYYDVPVAFATAQRPAFNADSGYSGYFIDLVGNWRTRNRLYFAFLRYQNLSGSEYEDSPLMEDNGYFAVGVGMAWILATSLDGK
jgi:outer membrane scaffolding protein for murein synthesis (MipA/OmpV family)